MSFDNGEETITKTSAKEILKNKAQQWKKQNTQYMRNLWIPPPQNKYLIINIINNILMTHFSKF